jgi:hypothetical protein
MKRKKSKIFIAGAIAFIAGFLTTVRGAPLQPSQLTDSFKGEPALLQNRQYRFHSIECGPNIGRVLQSSSVM